MAGLLLTRRLAKQCEGELRALPPEVSVVLFPDDDSPVPEDELATVEMAYASPDIFEGTRSALPFLDALRDAPNLRWAHIGWAGIDNPRVGGLLERGVRVSNSPDAAAEPIAQSAITGLLSLARRFPYFAEGQRKHSWDRLPATMLPPDLSTQTLVVFGLGTIGREIARLAQAFGLHVIGVKRSPRTPDDTVDELVHPDALDSVLPRADWLAVAAPLTQETSGVIGAARLDLMPPGAHVINIARGKIIDEAALVARLQSGVLGGAYLDVFGEEPLSPDSPLWDLPNVIVSPHSSWIALGNPERARGNFLANLDAWIKSEPLPHEVSER